MSIIDSILWFLESHILKSIENFGFLRNWEILNTPIDLFKYCPRNTLLWYQYKNLNIVIGWQQICINIETFTNTHGLIYLQHCTSLARMMMCFEVSWCWQPCPFEIDNQRKKTVLCFIRAKLVYILVVWWIVPFLFGRPKMSP